ncbi:Na+/H+ antiporter subunit D, partial [Staphylococcus capitis]
LDDAEDVAFVDRADVGRIPAGMLAPTLGLIAVGVALTIFAGPIIAISDRAAAEVRDRTVYISAVLGGAPR